MGGIWWQVENSENGLKYAIVICVSPWFIGNTSLSNGSNLTKVNKFPPSITRASTDKIYTPVCLLVLSHWLSNSILLNNNKYVQWDCRETNDEVGKGCKPCYYHLSLTRHVTNEILLERTPTHAKDAKFLEGNAENT